MKLLKHLFKKDNKVELDKLIASFKALRQKSDIAVLSPHPTGYAWLGVYNGGKSMFANNFISLSHYYSHSVFNKYLYAHIYLLGLCPSSTRFCLYR